MFDIVTLTWKDLVTIFNINAFLSLLSTFLKKKMAGIIVVINTVDHHRMETGPSHKKCFLRQGCFHSRRGFI